MRISYWSSDVCSADLAAWRDGARPHREPAILAALKAALILAENAGALLKQHDAAIIGVDIARDDAGRIARYGAVHSRLQRARRSEEHTSELQSLKRTSSPVLCLTQDNNNDTQHLLPT